MLVGWGWKVHVGGGGEGAEVESKVRKAPMGGGRSNVEGARRKESGVGSVCDARWGGGHSDVRKEYKKRIGREAN